MSMPFLFTLLKLGWLWPVFFYSNMIQVTWSSSWNTLKVILSFFFLKLGMIFHSLHFPVTEGNGKGENSAFWEYSGTALSPKRVLNAMKQSSSPLSGRECAILEVWGHFYSLMNSSGAFTSERALAPFLPFMVLLVSPQWFPLYLRKMNQVGISILHSFQICGYSEDLPFPYMFFLPQWTPNFLQEAAALFSSCLYTSTNYFSCA